MGVKARVLLAVVMATLAPMARSQSILILSASEIKHPPPKAHVAELVHSTATQMGLAETDLPHITFVYAPRESGSMNYLARETAVFVQTIERSDGAAFEAWILGEPSDERTVLGICAVFNRRFQLHLTEDGIRNTRDRVLRQRNQTVSIDNLRSHK